MAADGSGATHTVTSSTGRVTVASGPVTTTTVTTVTMTASEPMGAGRHRAALALDIGGTKLAAGIVDASGAVLGRARRPMPRTLDPEVTFGAAVECLHAALGDAGLGGRYDYAGLAGLGVGCGGPMVWPSGEVSPLNIPSWRGFPLRARLRDAFGGLVVLVHNDAVALAAGEHWTGTGRDVRNLLAVTVSTGVGGGLVLDGRLFHGRTGNAGHIGHLVVDPNGPDCVCGGVGCLEAIASGPRTVAWALDEGWRAEPASGAEAALAAAGSGDVAPGRGPAGDSAEPVADGRALAASAAAGQDRPCGAGAFGQRGRHRDRVERRDPRPRPGHRRRWLLPVRADLLGCPARRLRPAHGHGLRPRGPCRAQLGALRRRPPRRRRLHPRPGPLRLGRLSTVSGLGPTGRPA